MKLKIEIRKGNAGRFRWYLYSEEEEKEVLICQSGKVRGFKTKEEAAEQAKGLVSHGRLEGFKAAEEEAARKVSKIQEKYDSLYKRRDDLQKKYDASLKISSRAKSNYWRYGLGGFALGAILVMLSRVIT